MMDPHGVDREKTNLSGNDCAQSKAEPPASRRQKPSPARRGTLSWVRQDQLISFTESC